MNTNDKFFEKFEKLYSEANEAIVLSPDFADRTLDAVFGTEKRKTISFKKTFTVLIAAVLLVAAFAGSVVAVDRIISAVRKNSVISENDHYSSASDEYIDFIGISDESNGLTITLSEAFFENRILNLVIEYDYSSDEEVTGNILHGFTLECGDIFSIYTPIADGLDYKTSDGRCSFMQFDLSEYELPANADFDLTINMAKLYFADASSKRISGPWEYSFTLRTGIIEENTVCYSIDRDITLDNGDRIYLDKIVCNPMSQRILYRIPDITPDGVYRTYALYAADSDGLHDFRFDHSYGENAESINCTPDNFDLSAESITLTFVVKGDMKTPLCDPIEIECRRITE